MTKFFKMRIGLVVVGLLIGNMIGLLSLYGNPISMGLCEINFIRDIAGSIRLHSMPIGQYFRPEIAGIILGSFVISLLTKKYKLTISKAGIVKCIFGFCSMIFGMIFLGSPLRTLERMSCGDLNALIGFIGLIVGMIIGNQLIKNGFNIQSEERDYKNVFSKLILPFILVIGLVIIILDTYGSTVDSKIFKISETGPASVHAGVIIATAFAFVIGILLELSELSFDNAYKNIVYKKSFAMMISGVCIFVSLLILNMISYNFDISFDGHIVAHKAHIWNFISMFGMGITLMLADGDPLRQMIRAGEGSIDSMLYIVGMLLACIIIYPLKLTSSAYSALPNGTWFVGGPIKNGVIATLIALVIVISIGVVGKNDVKGAHK